MSDVISITEVQGTLGNGSYQMEQEAEVLVRALNVKLCVCVHVSDERVLLYLSITAGSARRHDDVSPQIQQGWSAALRFSL